MKKPFKETKIGKLINSKVGKVVQGLVINGLQAVPVVGTLVTNIKTNTAESPAGKMNIGKSEIYRIAIGLLVALALHGDLFTPDQLHFIFSIVGL